MVQHAIWAAGLIGHLILVIVLLASGRARRFPFFTLLIVFDIVRALTLALVLPHMPHPAVHVASIAFDVTDLVLEFGTLTELILTALRPLDRLRRVTLPLLLLAAGIVTVTHLAPVSHYTGRAAPLLLHFLLGVLMLGWALILILLRGPLRLHWRSDVAAISFGFGVYSAALLFGGGYFRVGRDMSDYIFFSYFRIFVYLAVVLWWIVALSSSQRVGKSASQRKAFS